MKKYYYIDIMRGLAIIAVIAMHSIFFENDGGILLTVSKFGQMGVQLFFVASALTLCLSMEHRGYNKSNRKEYFLRRFFRIAPMYYVGILLYFVISIIRNYHGLESNYEMYTFSGVLSNVFLAHGFIPAYNNNIVFGGWSIGTEVGFYLIFPFLFIMLRDKSPLYIFKIIVAYTILTFAVIFGISSFYEGFIIRNNTFSYYNLFNQFPVFLWGIIFYRVLKIGNIKLMKYFIGAAVGLLAFFISWYSQMLLSFYFVPLFIGLVFLCFGVILSQINIHIPLIEKIGQRSYSIYIVHFTFCWFIFPILDDLFLVDLNANIRFLTNFSLTLIFSYLIASLTKKYVEDPFLSLGNNAIKYLNDKKVATKTV